MLPAIVTFGKHKGRTITEVPTAYLQWLVQEEVDGYMSDGSPIIEVAEKELDTRYDIDEGRDYGLDMFDLM